MKITEKNIKELVKLKDAEIGKFNEQNIQLQNELYTLQRKQEILRRDHNNVLNRMHRRYDCFLNFANNVAGNVTGSYKWGNNFNGRIRQEFTFGDVSEITSEVLPQWQFGRKKKSISARTLYSLTLSIKSVLFMHECQETLRVYNGERKAIIHMGPTLKKDVYEVRWVEFRNHKLQTVDGYVAITDDLRKRYSNTNIKIAGFSKTLIGAVRTAKATAKELRLIEDKTLLSNSKKITMEMVIRMTGWCRDGCETWTKLYLQGRKKVTREELLEAANIAKDDPYNTRHKEQTVALINFLTKRE